MTENLGLVVGVALVGLIATIAALGGSANPQPMTNVAKAVMDFIAHHSKVVLTVSCFIAFLKFLEALALQQ